MLVSFMVVAVFEGNPAEISTGCLAWECESGVVARDWEVWWYTFDRFYRAACKADAV